jgi:ABC-type amino acid transport substrate-binding protein
MLINAPTNRQDLEDIALMNWPESKEGDSHKYVENKKYVPKGEACTEFNTYTTFTLPKKGKFHRLAAYPNKIYCRTASMLSGVFSAHIVRMGQTGTLQKLLTKYNVKDTKVPTCIDPKYIELSLPGVLRVSAPTFLPVMDATRKIGIDVEIFKAFAKVLKVKLELKTIMTESLSYDDANYAIGDVWAGGLSFNVERENSYTQWTAPYLFTKRSCIFRAEDDFKKVKDVTGSVYVRGSSSAEDDARQQGMVAKTVDDSEMTEDKVFQDVLDGKMSGVLRGSIVAKALKKAYPGKFSYIEWERDPKQPESLHYMVSTRSNLNVALSAFVQRLMCTGQMDDIIERSSATMKSLGLRVQRKTTAKRVKI